MSVAASELPDRNHHATSQRTSGIRPEIVFFKVAHTFSLHNGTKSLSPSGLTTHSLNMSILPLKNKGSYQTDETPFLNSKAEVTQYSIDMNYSLEKITHICAPHNTRVRLP